MKPFILVSFSLLTLNYSTKTGRNGQKNLFNAKFDSTMFYQVLLSWQKILQQMLYMVVIPLPSAKHKAGEPQRQPNGTPLTPRTKFASSYCRSTSCTRIQHVRGTTAELGAQHKGVCIKLDIALKGRNQPYAGVQIWNNVSHLVCLSLADTALSGVGHI